MKDLFFFFQTYPAKFMLSYLPRERCKHEYVSVTPNGVRFRGQIFPTIGQMFVWFKKHFRDARPVGTPKTPCYTTPGTLLVVESVALWPKYDLNIQYKLFEKLLSTILSFKRNKKKTFLMKSCWKICSLVRILICKIGPLL